MIFLAALVSAPLQAGWGMNDATIVYPLPQSASAMNQLLAPLDAGPGGALLPLEYWQRIPSINQGEHSSRTYRNGDPHGYDGRRPEEPNLLGFVPILLAPFLAGENGIGENAFAGAAELLNRVNDAASQALDVIQRNAEPLTVFSGVSEVQFDPANNAITLDKADAKAYTLVPNLVIDHALALIDKVLQEFKNVLPQLLFDQLMSRNDLAYNTVLTLLSELIDHVNDARTHVDEAIETAERWALLAGQQMGAFPASLDPALHRLNPDRPVIAPPPGQRLALEAQRVGVDGARRALTTPQEGPTAPMDDDEDPQEEDPANE